MITKAVQGKDGGRRAGDKGVMTGAGAGEMPLLEGATSQGCGQPLDAEESKKRLLLQSLQEKCSPADISVLALYGPF